MLQSQRRFFPKAFIGSISPNSPLLLLRFAFRKTVQWKSIFTPLPQVGGACTASHCRLDTKVRIDRWPNPCMHARTPVNWGTKVGQYWQMRRYIYQALSTGVGVTEQRCSGRTVIASIVWCAPDSIRIESAASVFFAVLEIHLQLPINPRVATVHISQG